VGDHTTVDGAACLGLGALLLFVDCGIGADALAGVSRTVAIADDVGQDRGE